MFIFAVSSRTCNDVCPYLKLYILCVVCLFMFVVIVSVIVMLFLCSCLCAYCCLNVRTYVRNVQCGL